MKRRASAKPTAPSAPDFFSGDVAEARRFYLDLNPAPSQRLVVVCGGLEHCTPDYRIRRSSFPFYSIEYVAQGRGELKLGGRNFSMQPGRLFSYGPNVSQEITSNTEAPLVKYFVDFAGKGAEDLLISCSLAPGTASEVFPTHSLQPLFEELIHAGLNSRGETTALCVKLLECLVLRFIGARAPTESAETISFGKYRQCRSYIEQHSLRLQTLEQIARECHVNNAYLCRLFRRYDHHSPYQYLLRLKMNFAAERLRRTGILVKQVAAETGFLDQFHFCRVFRSVFGVSPTAFRGLR